MAELREVVVAEVTADVTVSTTTETVLVTTDSIFVPTPTARVVVMVHVVHQTGAGTTGVHVQLRRGTTIGGTLLHDDQTFALPSAAGGTDQWHRAAVDELENLDSVQYCCTLAQIAATADGTTRYAVLTAFLLE